MRVPSIITLVIVCTLLTFTVSNVYSEKIRCAEDIDLQKYPICKYESEWNESEEFNELVVVELTKQEKRINDNPDEFFEIYQKIIDQVNVDNPGLLEKCQEIKDWIFGQISTK